MTKPLSCAEVRDEALVERYAARLLDETESARFEIHLLTCAACQADVKLAAAIRATRGVAFPARRIAWWSGIAATAAVVALALAWPRPDPAVMRLGEVSAAPVYDGVPVRSASGQRGDSLFAAAMMAYGARDYVGAERRLVAALAAGVDAAPAEFFRGASLMMQDRARAAAAAYRRVIGLGPTPYLAEARWYLAKCLLRDGRRTEALEELAQLENAGDSVGALARALADTIRALPR